MEWKDLSDQNIGPEGKAALSFGKELWRHAETEHFIYHFKESKQAETVYVHAEVYYRWIKELFGVANDSWTQKAHIFIFEDETEWKDFLIRVHPRLQGDAYTNGRELFIYRDPYWLSPMQTTAHEITHLVVFRFLEGPIPLSLNEGFAEFVSFRALAMQMGQSEFDLRTIQLMPAPDYISVQKIIAMDAYPQSNVPLFYRESELFCRFLILSYSRENFYRFLKEISQGKPFDKSVQDIYSETPETLEQKFRAYAVSAN